MFEAEKNRKIVSDLSCLAVELKMLTDQCEKQQLSSVGKMTPQLGFILSRVDTHVRQMVQAKIRHDEILGDRGDI